MASTDTTCHQCYQKKKLVTEASDADNRLSRNSRLKESLLDGCHWCYQCHWKKSESLNFLFFIAYIHHIYIIHILYHDTYISLGQHRKFLIFFLEFITLLLVTLVTVIKKGIKQPNNLKKHNEHVTGCVTGQYIKLMTLVMLKKFAYSQLKKQHTYYLNSAHFLAIK